MPTPQYSLNELYNLSADAERYQALRSLVAHILNQEGDISSLSGGGTPGFNSAIDSRFVLVHIPDSPQSTTALSVTPNTAPSGSPLPSIETGAYYILVPGVTNTGATTLDIGTSEGAVAIKKYSSGSKADVESGDLVATKPVLIAFDGTHWIADVQAKTTAPTTQVFTSSGTWNRPSGCIGVIVEVQGAGGEGGGEASGAAGNAGGNSSWSDGTNTITAVGGSGGAKASDSDGGAGGTGGSGGDLAIPGEDGGGSNTNVGGQKGDGRGGGSVLGHGGVPLVGTDAAQDGKGYGGGGSGEFAIASNDCGAGGGGGEYRRAALDVSSIASSTITVGSGGTGGGAGGDGAPGIVLVTEFY